MTSAIRTRIGLGAAAGVAVALMALAPVSGSTPRFFDDDPITRVPESQDASGVAEWEIDLFYDLMYNTFGTPRTIKTCLLYTSPSPRDGLLSRMPSSA